MEQENIKLDEEQYMILNPQKCRDCKIKYNVGCNKCPDSNEIVKSWNEYRKANLYTNIYLQGANFCGRNLEGIFLNGGKYHDSSAPVETRKFQGEVHLEGANFNGANLVNSVFVNAHLEGAHFYNTDLNKSCFVATHLEGAKIINAHLEGAVIKYACIQQSSFYRSIVDGSTEIWNCELDRSTDFRGVGLSSLRIDDAKRQLLEYNIRRLNWEGWYKDRPYLKWFAKPFWLLSDYGRSIGRIITWFFVLAISFGFIYFLFGVIDLHCFKSDNPGIVNNLMNIEMTSPEQGSLPWWHVLPRSIYFSIVTMTTLGFGDMHANPESKLWFLGYLLLMFQVLLGYVILGALITRFAVLFTAGGPAGDFIEMDQDTTNLLKRLKEKDKFSENC